MFSSLLNRVKNQHYSHISVLATFLGIKITHVFIVQSPIQFDGPFRNINNNVLRRRMVYSYERFLKSTSELYEIFQEMFPL